MRFLDKYLASLAADPLIRSSQILQDFLHLEEKDFNNRKKEYNKLKPPTKISENRAVDGQVFKKLNLGKNKSFKRE